MQSLPTCTRPCLVPNSIPNQDRECDVIYSCPIKCTDQCDRLHVLFDLYKRANISKLIIRFSLFFTSQTKAKSVTFFPSKNKQIFKTPPATRFSCYFLAEKITIKFTSQNFFLFSLFLSSWQQIRSHSTEQKVNQQGSPMKSQGILSRAKRSKSTDSRLRLISSLKHAIVSRHRKC